MSHTKDVSYKPVDDKDVKESDDVMPAPKPGLFKSPVFFAIIVMIQAALGVAAMAYFGACISTIEKRFQLKSSQSGIIVATNDAIGLVILLFVIHYGKSRHRPRIIAALYATVAIGSLVHIIPHLVYPIPSSLGKNIENEETEVFEPGFCDGTNSTTTQCTETEVDESGSLLNQAVWLFIGQALASCLSCTYPLYITYLDDGVSKKALAVYMGFYFSMFAVGGGLGFALSSFCLALPAYINNEDYVTSVQGSDDPRWIGAWWLGFLIIGSIQLFLAIPLFFFPKFLPRAEYANEDSEGNEYVAAATEELHIAQEEPGTIGFLKGLVKSVWRVVTNPTVLALIICFIFLSGFISSFPLFGAKYIQYQFGVRPEFAAVIFGAVLLPAGVTGNIFGGFLIKRFAKTRLQLATILLIISSTCVLVDPLMLIFGCQNKDIAGLTAHYPSEILETPNVDIGAPDGIDSGCNEDCHCAVAYSPICGADGITYSSPCHAGCTGSIVVDDTEGTEYTVYANCSCITARFTSEEKHLYPGDDVGAVHGECEKPCNKFIPYLISYFITMFLGPMCANPATLLKIRSVDRTDRSMSISVSDITGKIFGFIPGPIYYGAAIDSSCLLFQSSCGETGNCLVYDIEKFRFVFYGITLTLQILATLAIVASYLTVRFDKKGSKKRIVDPVPLKQDLVD